MAYEIWDILGYLLSLVGIVQDDPQQISLYHQAFCLVIADARNLGDTVSNLVSSSGRRTWGFPTASIGGSNGAAPESGGS